MWVGTDKGLYRFDGYTFTSFHAKPKDSTALPHDFITALAEDSTGALWIGTRSGFCTYDRKRSVFQRFPRITATVRAMLCARDGTMWIGTDDGLYSYNPTTKRSTALFGDESPNRISFANATTLANSNVRALRQDDRGMLWIQTEPPLPASNPQGYLFIHEFAPATNTLRRHAITVGNGTGVPSKANQFDDYAMLPYSLPTNVQTAQHDSSKAAHLLVRLQPHNERLPAVVGAINATRVARVMEPQVPHRYYPLVSAYSSGELRICIEAVITQGTQNYIWVSVEDYEHTTYSRASRSGLYYLPITATTLPSKPLVQGLVTAFCQDRLGTAWVGVNRLGLAVVKQSRIQEYTPDHGIGENTVTAIFKDHTNTLWLGTENGINRLDAGSTTWKQYLGKQYLAQKNIVVENGSMKPSQMFINAIIEDSHHRLLAATNHGVFRFDRRTDVWKPLQCLNTALGGVPIVRMLVDTLTDNYWLYAPPYGLCLFDKNERLIKRFEAQKDSGDISMEPVFTLFQDRKGTIWVGTLYGLNRWQPQTRSFRQYKDERFGKTISALTEDAAGNLVLGFANNGISTYNSATDRFTRDIFSKSTTDTLANKGLYSNIVSVLVDKHGDYWLLSAKGRVSRLSPDLHSNDSKIISTIHIPENEPSTTVVAQSPAYANDGAGFQDASGRLYFSHGTGCIALHPDDIISQSIPIVALTAIMHKTIPIASEVQHNDTITIRFNDILTLEAGVFSVLSGFSDLNNNTPEQNKYSFLLEERGTMGAMWTEPTVIRTCRYNRLSWGSYVFRVKGCNAEGVWNEQGVGVVIIVLKPFWAETWFVAVAIGVVMVGSIGAVRYKASLTIAKQQEQLHRQSLEHDNEHLKREKEMLNRIAAELQLTTLQLQLNPHFVHNALLPLQTFILQEKKFVALKYISIFAALLKTMLGQMHSPFAPLTEVITVMDTYITLEQFRTNDLFTYTLQYPPEQEIRHVTIPFMIFQPYIENAIRHGLQPLEDCGFERAARLSVELRCTKTEVQCVIEDNGIGRVASKLLSSEGIRRAELATSTTIIAERLAKLEQLHRITIDVQYTDLVDNDESSICTGTRVIVSVPFVPNGSIMQEPTEAPL